MSGNIEVKIYETPDKVANAFAKELFRIISESTQKRFDIALSGGETPKLLFRYLSSKYPDLIPWHRLHFWWGDERCVSPDDEESNYGSADMFLFSEIAIPVENIHRIKGENDPDDEADSYSQQLREQLNNRNEWPVFDLVMLGLGKDGHTASIFPDQMELLESDKICEVATHPESGQKRITLTGKVINNANRIFFLVTGKAKAKRVSQIMNNLKKAKKFPASYIAPLNGDLYWYLDEAAAERIS